MIIINLAFFSKKKKKEHKSLFSLTFFLSVLKKFQFLSGYLSLEQPNVIPYLFYPK